MMRWLSATDITVTHAEVDERIGGRLSVFHEDADLGAIADGAESIAHSWLNPKELDDNGKMALKASAAAYNDNSGGPSGPLSVSWIYKDGAFSATLFELPNGGYMLAFRGTVVSELGDWVTDIAQAFGFKTSQYQQAAALGKAVYEATEGNVIFVGHSLGGGLAMAAAVATGGSAITFNAAGLNAFSGNGDHIQNYFIRGEPLTTLQTLTPLPRAWGTQIPYAGGHSDLGGHGISSFSH